MIVLVPFINKLINIVNKIFPDRDKNSNNLYWNLYLNNAVFDFPDTALISLIKEVKHLYKNTIEVLIESIWLVANEYSNQAKEKTNQIFNLGSTWIYADWFEWNSPFDLIVDLQNIDSIIFMEDSTVYEWNTDLDLAWEISNLIDNANELNRTPLDILNLNVINENVTEFCFIQCYELINQQHLCI